MHFLILSPTLLALSTIITLTLSNKVAAQHQHTAVLFGSSGAVGSEILKSLLDNDNNDDGSSFDEVILIGRKSSPKVDEILTNRKKQHDTDTPKVTSLILPNLNDELASYDKIEKADVCFVAIGIGDVNAVTLQYWHSVEVDLIGTISRFCTKLQVKSITLLSAVDVDYESAAPFSEQDMSGYDDEKPLGWMTGIYLYNRVKSLEEKAVVDAATSISHVRMFRPSSIVTEETRYGWVDKMFFFLHGWADSIIPLQYHSVDVRLLGMAMVADAEEVLTKHIDSSSSSDMSVAQLTYADYLRVAGEAFKERYQLGKDEL